MNIIKRSQLIIGLISILILCNFSLKNHNEPIVFTSINNGYTVNSFYKKIDLDYGTLDENGQQISFIYSKTSIDAGDYNIELIDASGDLYKIKGTNLYVTFNSYFGYAGYGTECVLRVKYYSSVIYKIE